MAEKTITQQILGKTVGEVTYADVLKYFQQDRKESVQLEFKSYVDPTGKAAKHNLEGVFEGICAMLNSDGGLIIWGAPVGTVKPGDPEMVFSGPLTSVATDYGEDQLNDLILGNVQEIPPKVQFKKLPDGNSRIYVIEVPRSPYAPHQYKGTYYARFGASTRVAPHYLVQALMRQITFPNIGISLTFHKIYRDTNGVVTVLLIATFKNYSRLQNERDLVMSIYTSKGVFIDRGLDRLVPVITEKGRQLVLHSAAAQLHYGMPLSTMLWMKIQPEHFIDDELIYLQASVAGRYSPMKYSHFEIRLALNEPDMSKLIRTIKENQLAKDNFMANE